MIKDFIKYDIPKNGLFEVLKPNGIYTNEGWETIQEQNLIIGETHFQYVYELREVEFEYWYEGLTYKSKCQIEISYHKSRLIKWLDTQLNLF
jgi:NOL1/NOP2/fmu family ribosome biogenesis protein